MQYIVFVPLIRDSRLQTFGCRHPFVYLLILLYTDKYDSWLDSVVI
jgi:hypothetical protein